MRGIGILGGTFDPIHNGHLQIAEYALQSLHLDAIRFVPCKFPVHKIKTHASVTERLTMLRLAIADHPNFFLDTQELDRDTPSYALLTLRSLRKAFPDRALCFILGSDAMNQINTWYHWQRLLDYAHLVVVERPQQPLLLLDELAPHLLSDPNALLQQPNGFIYQLSMPICTLSSTEIREKLSRSRSVTEALPPAVLQYCLEQKIYLQN